MAGVSVGGAVYTCSMKPLAQSFLRSFGLFRSMDSLEPPVKRFCSDSSQINTVRKIAVEGNIATGKSTFLNIVADYNPSYQVVQEPLSRWTNVPSEDHDMTASQECGGNLLDLFYKDPKRWAYTFQTYACLSRLRAQLKSFPEEVKKIPNPVVFYERSVYSDKFCFAQHCHESGMINDTEWSVYCDWYSFLLESLPLEFDGFIYLKSSPKVSFKRLRNRNRPEESGVTLEYLESLHKNHENWLVYKKVKPPLVCQRDVPVLILDCDPEFENNKERQAVLLKQVQDYLEN